MGYKLIFAMFLPNNALRGNAQAAKPEKTMSLKPGRALWNAAGNFFLEHASLKGIFMKSRHVLFALPCALFSLVAMAAGNHAGDHGEDVIGKPGVASKVTRTVVVDLRDDMRFHSSVFSVKQGETIRFVAKNSGKVKHEMVLGTAKDLKDHYEVMKKNPEMEHDDPNMVTVAPGKSGEIIWQFTSAGKVDFACLQPGHFDAGMKGLVNVASSKAPAKDDDHGQHKH